MIIILSALAVFIAFLIGYVRFIEIKRRYDTACFLKKYSVALAQNRREMMLSSYDVLNKLRSDQCAISSAAELYAYLSEIGCDGTVIDALKKYNSADISSIDNEEKLMLDAFERQYTEQSKKYNENGKLSLIVFPLIALGAVIAIL